MSHSVLGCHVLHHLETVNAHYHIYHVQSQQAHRREYDCHIFELEMSCLSSDILFECYQNDKSREGIFVDDNDFPKLRQLSKPTALTDVKRAEWYLMCLLHACSLLFEHQDRLSSFVYGFEFISVRMTKTHVYVLIPKTEILSLMELKHSDVSEETIVNAVLEMLSTVHGCKYGLGNVDFVSENKDDVSNIICSRVGFRLTKNNRVICNLSMFTALHRLESAPPVFTMPKLFDTTVESINGLSDSIQILLSDIQDSKARWGWPSNIVQLLLPLHKNKLLSTERLEDWIASLKFESGRFYGSLPFRHRLGIPGFRTVQEYSDHKNSYRSMYRVRRGLLEEDVFKCYKFLLSASKSKVPVLRQMYANPNAIEGISVLEIPPMEQPFELMGSDAEKDVLCLLHSIDLLKRHPSLQQYVHGFDQMFWYVFHDEMYCFQPWFYGATLDDLEGQSEQNKAFDGLVRLFDDFHSAGLCIHDVTLTYTGEFGEDRYSRNGNIFFDKRNDSIKCKLIDIEAICEIGVDYEKAKHLQSPVWGSTYFPKNIYFALKNDFEVRLPSLKQFGWEQDVLSIIGILLDYRRPRAEDSFGDLSDSTIHDLFDRLCLNRMSPDDFQERMDVRLERDPRPVSPEIIEPSKQYNRRLAWSGGIVGLILLVAILLRSL